MRTLNLGILAHVDAGKTTLTERLLYAAGVIDEPGNVDDGTTQTDTLALEQQRGITIKTAVVSFTVADVKVNLIDTPGHPDFIAEVERALAVLDGAVLVLSAVEGVQPQTRILFRALQRLRVPTVMFVNKIDRRGADGERVLGSIAARLTNVIVPMGTTRNLGTRDAEFILTKRTAADRDLAGRTRDVDAYPVYFGSALTGAGVAVLTEGLVELLTPPPTSADGPVAGRVFKVERASSGQKIAYVRLFSGALRTRNRVGIGEGEAAKVSRLETFIAGRSLPAPSLVAGDIGKVWGLAPARVGDAVGEVTGRGEPAPFPPPTMEAAVVPTRPADRVRLRQALGQLAEQDPLINVHVDDEEGELVVSLYGEVQKEVIQATLWQDYDLEATFRETTTVCIERPAGTGEAVEFLWSESHPYAATVGLRLEPAPAGSGLAVRLDVDPRTVPIHIYKSHRQFLDHMTDYVSEALASGRFGWQVTDCLVTMTQCGSYVGDGKRKPVSATPRTSANDFRKVTALVVREAIERAGTVVCEPTVRVSIEAPGGRVGTVVAFVAGLGAEIEPPSFERDLATVTAVMPSASARELSPRLPVLTAGEGVMETTFAGYRATKQGGLRRRRRRPVQ